MAAYAPSNILRMSPLGQELRARADPLQCGDGSGNGAVTVQASQGGITLSAPAGITLPFTAPASQAYAAAVTFACGAASCGKVQLTSVNTAANSSGSGSVITVSTTACTNSTSTVLASIVGYTGTPGTNGVPIISAVTPGANSFTFTIGNASANALSGSVTVAWLVVNSA